MRRIEQVNDLIRAEVGKIIDRDVELPAGSLVTITQVATSPDLHYADIFITVMPHSREVGTFAALEKGIGGIQHALNRRLRMRPVPRIKFVVDVKQKRADRIEKLLARENLKKSQR
ncbi:MAG: 30S ribosome-binding factor RbfA [Candidatus Sungbacteria bacterium]|uniref:Ribosome-binding factor A n=1 Tax=Candidatus Sungiibacteriota bacterium TaxID=2750080 RepID=A0A931WMX4_9BACT|nr:30S ribosome-binding factor RbfA [Candidatus Sungbacteria bacterium]